MNYYDFQTAESCRTVQSNMAFYFSISCSQRTQAVHDPQPGQSGRYSADLCPGLPAGTFCSKFTTQWLFKEGKLCVVQTMAPIGRGHVSIKDTDRTKEALLSTFQSVPQVFGLSFLLPGSNWFYFLSVLWKSAETLVTFHHVMQGQWFKSPHWFFKEVWGSCGWGGRAVVHWTESRWYDLWPVQCP